MVEIEDYLTRLLAQLQRVFSQRLLYLGLQGSYLRNEQHEGSDIDVMVILDQMTVEDLGQYKNALISVGDYEKSCGFICGREELSNWNPLEICHLLHTTKDIYGSLTGYLPSYTKEDVRNFIKLSVGNLYHELCHRYIHASREKNVERLPAVYRSVFFILQNLAFTQKGVFYPSKKELIRHLEGEDQAVLAMLIKLQNGCGADFDHAFHLLFTWCQSTLRDLKAQTAP